VSPSRARDPGWPASAATYQAWLHEYNHHRAHGGIGGIGGIGGLSPINRVHNVPKSYS